VTWIIRGGENLRERILKLLKASQDGYISGEEISRKLGISRTAVWKHMNKLKDEGYEIEAVTKLGYKLRGIPDLLVPEEIKSKLDTKVMGQRIYYFEEIDSTNSYCKILGEQKVPEGALVVAEHQRSGRGRLGRSWISPAKKGLWFSLLLRPQVSSQEASQLTILAAVAVARVLHRKYQLPVGIKWPNDLLLDGKKFAGILLEMKTEAEQVDYLILGIGVNVNITCEEFPQELAGEATSLQVEKGSSLARVELLTAILKEIEELYLDYLANGFNKIMELWKKYNVTLGQTVSITNWQQTWQGQAYDLDANGGLIILLPDGTMKTFYSGDVTLKR